MRTLTITAAIAAAVIALAGCKSSTSASGPAPAASGSASAKAVVHHRKTVTYIVTGSTAQVTYGPAGSSLNGTVPMHKTRKLHHPQYYAISAQLQGGGAVHCKIKVDGKTISHSTATGGYNIAQCEIVQDVLSGKWESAAG
jgi:hypothetical protein